MPGSYNSKDLRNLPNNTNAALASVKIEKANLAAFPTVGNTNSIYVAKDTNFIYRWSGTAYVQIGGGGNGNFLKTDMANNTIQYVDVTNTSGLGQSSRQIHIGANLPINDTGLNFQKGALINVTTTAASGGGKPIFESFSVPDTLGGTANGMLWLNYPQVGGYANYMLMVRSNSGEGGSVDICYTERLLISERSGVLITGKVINIQGFTDASKDHMFPGGGDKQTLTGRTSILQSIQNNDSPRWELFSNGDVHANGANVTVPLTVTANWTPTVANRSYLFTGGAGVTCTLPDPTLAINNGWEIEIINMGTGFITLSRNVLMDAATPNIVVPTGHPNNKLRMRCDNTIGWYAI